MSNEKDAMPFKWWMELNKHSGYEQLSMCNQSIEAGGAFERMFNFDYAGYLTVNDLTCVPNLQDRSNEFYYTSVHKLVDNGELDVYKWEVINAVKATFLQIILNNETLILKSCLDSSSSS